MSQGWGASRGFGTSGSHTPLSPHAGSKVLPQAPCTGFGKYTLSWTSALPLRDPRVP